MVSFTIRVVRKAAVKGFFAIFRGVFKTGEGVCGSRICRFLQKQIDFLSIFTPSSLGTAKFNLQSFSFCLKACQSISETFK